MYSKIVCFILIILFCITPVSFAQQQKVVDSSGKTIFQGGLNPTSTLKSMSLLDPERFTMRQQTMMSYSSSSRGGSSGLQGMYLNTMEYRFKMPLTMRLRVAYQNNMSSLFSNSASNGGRNAMETGNLYIPSFDLIYQPWKNTIISFHFRDFSGSNNYNYYNRYNRYNRFR
ncbi:hypothetical protein ACFL6H_08000 [Candidatus Latescibacterota bacterium]